MADDKIPVTILSGFLGSGKTTLLNRLLQDPRLTDTAVIVNEFGEIGLDHLLVESAFDEMVLLDNGCLCCSVRGDLVDTLRDLHEKAARGEIPAFGRVMVETTGLADPAPIAQTLVTDPYVAGRFALHGIVVTVDGANGVYTLGAYDEAQAQAAMADLLILTKGDLAGADIAGAAAAVRALNPHAPLVVAENGAVDPGAILAIDPAQVGPAGERGENARQAGGDGHSHDHGHGHDHAHHPHTHESGRIETASLIFDAPLDWGTFAGWLDWLTALRGPDILRVKGIVAVAGQPGPVLVHGVQHVFSPPVVLPDWPDDDHRSRLVVIARDIPAAAIRASFERFSAANAAA